jgi:transcriptional regulator
MHPNPKFQMRERDAMAEIVRQAGFGALVANTDAGLRCVHVPVLLEGDRLLFHMSRSNLLHPACAQGCDALFIVNGPHGYVSPDWYGLPDRVPTWNYVAVELNGPVAPLGDDELVILLDAMSAQGEARLAPKTAWTRAQMGEGRFEGLLKAITGFSMAISEWRGTRKLNQDKPQDVRMKVAEALEANGASDLARETRP